MLFHSLFDLFLHLDANLAEWLEVLFLAPVSVLF